MAEKSYEGVLKLGGNTIGKAQDVTPELDADEQETTTRDDNGWDNWETGHKRLTADFTALWVPTDAGIAAIEDAFFDGSDLSFEITDSNGYGWQGTCGVMSLSNPQNLTDAMTMDVSIKSKGQVAQMPVGS